MPQRCLKFYDRFGALQPLLQPEVVPPRKRKFRRSAVLGPRLAGLSASKAPAGALTP
jgi:hypothetical protein